MQLDDLKTTIFQLSDDELAVFARWFENYMAEVWKNRIEEDIRFGRLESAGRKIDAKSVAEPYQQP